MELLLTINVTGLGKAGEVVRVNERTGLDLKAGGQAVEATSTNLALWRLKQQLPAPPPLPPLQADRKPSLALGQPRPRGSIGVPTRQMPRKVMPLPCTGEHDLSGMNEVWLRQEAVRVVDGHLTPDSRVWLEPAHRFGPAELRVTDKLGNERTFNVRVVPWPLEQPTFLLEDLLRYADTDQAMIDQEVLSRAEAKVNQAMYTSHAESKLFLTTSASSLMLNRGLALSPSFVDVCLRQYTSAAGLHEFTRRGNYEKAQDYYRTFLRIRGSKGLLDKMDFEIVKHYLRTYLFQLKIHKRYEGLNTEQIGQILEDITRDTPATGLRALGDLYGAHPDLMAQVLGHVRDENVLGLLMSTAAARYKEIRGIGGMRFLIDLSMLDFTANSTMQNLRSLLEQISTGLEDYFAHPEVEIRIANYARATRIIETAIAENEKAINSLGSHVKLSRIQLALQGLRRLLTEEHQQMTGGVKLVVTFTNDRIPFGMISAIEVEIKNLEEGVAGDVRLVVSGSEDYLLTSETVQFGNIAGRELEVREILLTGHSEQNAHIQAVLHYQDVAGKQISEQIQHTITFTDPSRFSEIRSPYYTGKPVDDPKMFFGRQDIIAQIGSNLLNEGQNPITVIHGQRRTGKSSILMQVKEAGRADTRAFGERYLIAYVNLESFGSFTDGRVLFTIAQRALTQLMKRGMANLPPIELKSYEDMPFLAFDTFLAALQEHLPEGKKILFIFDEFDTLIDSARDLEAGRKDKGISRDLFAYLREVLLAPGCPFSFMIAGQDELVNMMKDYTERLYDATGTPIEVSVLDEASAKALIVEPIIERVNWYSGAIDRVIRQTACHPHIISKLCQEIIARLNRDKRDQVTVSDVITAANRLIHAGDIFASVTIRMGRLELLVLCALAHLVDEVSEWAETRLVSDRVLVEAGVSLDHVERALQRLTGSYFLEAKTVGQSRRYRIRMGMLREYVLAKIGFKELAAQLPSSLTGAGGESR